MTVFELRPQTFSTTKMWPRTSKKLHNPGLMDELFQANNQKSKVDISEIVKHFVTKPEFTKQGLLRFYSVGHSCIYSFCFRFLWFLIITHAASTVVKNRCFSVKQ